MLEMALLSKTATVEIYRVRSSKSPKDGLRMSLGSALWVVLIPRTGLRTIGAIPLSLRRCEPDQVVGFGKNHLSTQPAYTPEYFLIVVANMLFELTTPL
jgi:hypothetical protein